MVGYEDNSENEQTPTSLTRRNVVKAGAATTMLGTIGSSVIFRRAVNAQEATAVDDETAATAIACTLTPELTEGPYYLDDAAVRRDITDGREGLPLTLRVNVVDTTACAALSNVAVDIWHCDSHGYYSGIEGNNPGPDATQEEIEAAADLSFLRGVQITDENGAVEFQTIYPGWYTGRTIHIHMKVIVDGEAGATYEDGHVSHTGQLFFDEALTEEVLALEWYDDRPNDERTLNVEDNILGDHIDEPGFLVAVERVNADTIEDGLVGTITIGVDPNSTPAGVNGGGGGDAQGGGPGGPGDGPPDGGAPGGTPPGGN